MLPLQAGVRIWQGEGHRLPGQPPGQRVDALGRARITCRADEHQGGYRPTWQKEQPRQHSWSTENAMWEKH